MLKIPEASINHASKYTFKWIHLLKIIIKQQSACWVANNVSFYLENINFTWKKTQA